MYAPAQSSKPDQGDRRDLKSGPECRPPIFNAPNDGSFLRSRILLAGAVVIVIAALSASAYLERQHSSRLASEQSTPAPQQPAEPSQPSTPAVERGEGSFFSQIFGSETSLAAQSQGESWLFYAIRVTFRLLLAALLATMLAFRPHKYIRLFRRNPYVAQTQILLAVVASALMMIVADNAARAFGIFAAASLVRFRTNIRDPKEITVLLISLAIGLATGVGRWEVALILSIFVLGTLWILENVESRQAVRSMHLKVRTHNVTFTDEILRKLFSTYNLTAEVRELDREDSDNPLGRIVYHLTAGPRVSTDQLSDEILSADPGNIDTVEWHQKKNVSYSYR